MKCQEPIDLDVFSFKRIYSEYELFIVKMHAKSPKNDTSNKNLNVLCDVELILGFPCCSHCLNVSISSSRLCKDKMFLYAILSRLSNWPNLNYTCCIVILLSSLKMLPLMFQCNWKLDKCNNGFLT
jgi:hypothetical protein